MTTTYPRWLYDGSEIPDPFGYGERAVEFLRRLRHPKSTLPGHAFQLDEWQERIVRRIYGPRHPDGSRIVKTVVLLLPRGNRKTSLSAALALLHTIGPERVPGGEAIFAAVDRTQASIAFRESVGIVREDPRIARATKIHDAHNSAKKITLRRDDATLEVVSSDGAAQHGRTPNFVLADELHVWPKRDLWEALTTGLEKSDTRLLVVATTAGRGQENIAWQIVEDARNVARGSVDDPSILPILFETPRDADWRDEDLWFAANPGLSCGYPSLDGMRSHAKRAERSIEERDSFRQLKLNIWLDNTVSPFVDMSIYDEGNAPVDLDALAGEPCWLGVDLSSNSDLTAVVAAWRQGADGYIVHPWFFCPEDNLRRKAEKDKVPYPAWAEAGHIIPTPGNVVDFRIVEDIVRDLCDRFDVREIAFDPHLARNILNNLVEAGHPAVEMRQGWVTMAPATKELERAIIGRRLQHGGHPVLRWCFDNIATHTDSAGNRMMHKGKSRDRIDGAVACAMAVGRASTGESGRSIYDDPAARPEGILFI